MYDYCGTHFRGIYEILTKFSSDFGFCDSVCIEHFGAKLQQAIQRTCWQGSVGIGTTQTASDLGKIHSK